jgi:nucleotide-binding universal stress UspA family protein
VLAKGPEGTVTEPQDYSGQRIVVGVDGSPSSRAALRWAVWQAQLTGASIEAITAWQAPTLVGITAPFASAEASDGGDGQIRASAESMLRTVVAQEVGPSTGIRVKAEVGEGSAAQLLLEAAKDAFLVVVGSRGHGGIAGTLLGSVSQSLAQHSPCPVLIIRGVE